jgi:hypothetical protein
MSIRTIYFDADGRKVGESVETDADRPALLKKERFTTPQILAAEAYLLDRGTQRRPARRDTRFK